MQKELKKQRAERAKELEDIGKAQQLNQWAEDLEDNKIDTLLRQDSPTRQRRAPLIEPPESPDHKQKPNRFSAAPVKEAKSNTNAEFNSQKKDNRPMPKAMYKMQMEDNQTV